MGQPKFLESVVLPGTKNDVPISFAYPNDDNSKCALTVICGENATGKTYLLRAIRAVIAGKTAARIAQPIVKLTDAGDRDPRCLLFTRTSREKDSAGRINVGIAQAKLSLTSDIPNYRVGFLRFVHSQLSHHHNWFPSLDNWLRSMDSRCEAVSRLPEETQIYPCNEAHSLVSVLEDVVGGRLFIRRCKGFELEFVLTMNNGLSVPYTEWSDGQKSAFYLCSMVELDEPDLVLIDEIENHFHPSYMSRVLSFLRERVAQAVIASHHPHMIFSRYVDRVIYIETTKQTNTVPRATMPMIYKKSQFAAAPSRTVRTLDSSFSHVAAAYNLFEPEDSLLLRQAQQTGMDFNFGLFEALAAIFSHPPVDASKRPLPDRQTLQVQSALSNLVLTSAFPQGDAVLLDVGSGLGRLPAELSKVSSWQLNTKVKWIAYEPNPQAREGLRSMADRLCLNVQIVERLDDVSDGVADLAVVANVLHEVPQQAFANIVIHATRALRKPHGALLIVEIYPLLHPERFAVPYPAAILEELFASLGFLCTTESIPIRESTGYALLARPSSKVVKHAEVLAALDQTWTRLLRKAANNYAARTSISDLKGYNAQLEAMATLASIVAAREGIWY